MSEESLTKIAATVHVELDPDASLDVELLTPEQALSVDVELLTPEQALLVGINPAAYRGEPGKAPKIGEDDYWYVWNGETESWENTGVFARGGVSDYEDLSNKPRINGVELSGDKSPQNLGLNRRISNSDIEALFRED